MLHFTEKKKKQGALAKKETNTKPSAKAVGKPQKSSVKPSNVKRDTTTVKPAAVKKEPGVKLEQSTPKAGPEPKPASEPVKDAPLQVSSGYHATNGCMRWSIIIITICCLGEGTYRLT